VFGSTSGVLRSPVELFCGLVSDDGGLVEWSKLTSRASGVQMWENCLSAADFATRPPARVLTREHTWSSEWI
jgi:hypothetical protein